MEEVNVGSIWLSAIIIVTIAALLIFVLGFWVGVRNEMKAKDEGLPSNMGSIWFYKSHARPGYYLITKTGKTYFFERVAKKHTVGILPDDVILYKFKKNITYSEFEYDLKMLFEED